MGSLMGTSHTLLNVLRKEELPTWYVGNSVPMREPAPYSSDIRIRTNINAPVDVQGNNATDEKQDQQDELVESLSEEDAQFLEELRAEEETEGVRSLSEVAQDISEDENPESKGKGKGEKTEAEDVVDEPAKLIE